MPKLNKSTIDQIDAPGMYRDTELRGFCMRVRPRKQGGLLKTYVVHNNIRGTHKVVMVTLGVHPIMSCDQARAAAKETLGKLAQGINPNEEIKDRKKELKRQIEIKDKEAEVDGLTLRKLLPEYIESHRLKLSTQKGYEGDIRRYLSDWRDIPLTSITKEMVHKRFLQLSKMSPTVANHTMRTLRALFRFAISVYEDPDGKPIIPYNPVDRIRDLRIWHKPRRRQGVVWPHQMKAWFEAVMDLRERNARDVLLIEILTGLRSSEALGLLWHNIDFDARMVTIEDTKNGLDHMIPMSTYLYEVLRKRRDKFPEGNDYVFEKQTSKYGHITDIRDSIRKAVQESGVEFSEHDLRRTFETTAESLDISYYTLKKLINHKTGNDPTAGYIITSAERMRVAAQRIADEMAKHMGWHLPVPPSASNVVVLKTRKEAVFE